MTFLLESQTANTDGSQDTIYLGNTLIYGSYYNLFAYGTWDTATMKLEISPDSGITWLDYGTDATFTANGWAEIRLNPGITIRGSVSSVGENTDLNLVVF